MTQFFAIFTAFLQAATKYLEYKNLTFFDDRLNQYDAEIDKLENLRAKLRSSTVPSDQKRAGEILDEILEEKEKRRLFLEKYGA